MTCHAMSVLLAVAASDSIYRDRHHGDIQVVEGVADQSRSKLK